MCFTNFLNKQYKRLLIALLILLVSSLSVPVSARSLNEDISLNATLPSYLASVASAAVSEQLDVLTGNDEVRSSSVDKAIYLDAIQTQISAAKSLRSTMLNVGVYYTEYTTELIDVSVNENSTTSITLHATEHTMLRYSHADEDPLAPDTSEYYQEHIFNFELQDSQWILVEDRLVNTFGPDNPIPLEQIVPVISQERLLFLPIVSNGQVSEVTSSTVAQVNGINRDSVVSYAYRYWNNYNTIYRDFSGAADGGDCTNFASQAIQAGGWSLTSGWAWDYQSTSEWWYRSYGQTWTWINVGYFRDFTINKNRGYTFLTFRSSPNLNGTFFKNISKGDILQADWTNDGKWDHTNSSDTHCNGNIFTVYLFIAQGGSGYAGRFSTRILICPDTEKL